MNPTQSVFTQHASLGGWHANYSANPLHISPLTEKKYCCWGWVSIATPAFNVIFYMWYSYPLQYEKECPRSCAWQDRHTRFNKKYLFISFKERKEGTGSSETLCIFSCMLKCFFKCGAHRKLKNYISVCWWYGVDLNTNSLSKHSSIVFKVFWFKSSHWLLSGSESMAGYYSLLTFRLIEIKWNINIIL